jgi:hypothetical protein
LLDVFEGGLGRGRAGPDVSGLGLQRADRGVLTENAADVLAVSHGDVGVGPGEAEGVVEELTETGAAGQAEKQKERGGTPHG